MKKVILLIALSVVFISAARLAAEYGVAWSVNRPPAQPGTLRDVKSIRLFWELIEIGLLGLGFASFGAAAVAYFLRKRIGKAL